MVGGPSVTTPSTSQGLFARAASFTGSQPRAFAIRLAALLGRPDLPRLDEIARLRPALRFLLLGLAAWVGLVGLVTLVSVVSVETSAMSFPVFGAHASAIGGQARSRGSYENIVQRPLFSRSRQAPAAADPPLPLPSPQPLVQRDRTISLRGVFISGASAKAFLTSTQNPLGIWVQRSEEIAGWRLVAIKPDEVVLHAQDDKLVIPLSVRGARK
jgi:hypothetical protein